MEDRLQNAEIEARAVAISKNVRCLECGFQSIEESAADIAVQLRKVIAFIASCCMVLGKTLNSYLCLPFFPKSAWAIMNLIYSLILLYPIFLPVYS